MTKAAGLIHGVVDYSANIIFGACVDENVQDEVEVTVIATGFPSGAEAAQNAARQNAFGTTLTVPAAESPAQQPVYPAQQGYAGAQQPAQPVQQPLYPNRQNVYGGAQQPAGGSAPAQPYPNAQQGGYATQPAPNGYPGAPNPYQQQGAQPVPPQGYPYAQQPQEPAEPQPDPEEEKNKLPPFIRRMLGKK